jgi:hypothetical protein
MTDLDNHKVVGSASVVMCELDSGLALLDLGRNKYFSLNNTGAVVWKAIEQPASLDNLCAAVAERFKIEQDACRSDVVSLLREFISSGLARAVDAPTD